MAEKTDLSVVVQKPTSEDLNKLNVFSWPIWAKDVSTFHWKYDDKEVCYLLEGEVTVTTRTGDVIFGKGDLVTFPQGLECVWNIRKAVKKHYKFG